MTLRDYFAAKAMSALIAQYPCQAIDDADGGRMTDSQRADWLASIKALLARDA